MILVLIVNDLSIKFLVNKAENGFNIIKEVHCFNIAEL